MSEDTAPDRIYLQTTESQEFEWTWAEDKIFEGDTEYVRADLAGPCRIMEYDGGFRCFAHNRMWGAVTKPDEPCAGWRREEGATGHWTGVEMMQARYLIAAMTGRTLEEVATPLSELCHSLRYTYTDDEVRALQDGDEVRGMVVTDLEAWEWEGEDGG